MKRIPAARIRTVWLDPHLTTAAAAAQVGLTRANLWRRAKALGLPPRKCGRHWSIGADQVAVFTRMWMRGDRVADIAAHFGISEPTVVYRCRSLSLPKRGKRHWNFAVGREDEFAAMWEAGIASAAIGAHFGAARRSVVERAHLMGLPPRPRGKSSWLPIEAWHEICLGAQMAAAAQRDKRMVVRDGR